MCILKSCVDWLRYFVQEHRWTQMLTSSGEDGSGPLPRYHHASVVVAIHDHMSNTQTDSYHLMIVVGGVTPNSVMNDTWSLNLSSLMWTEYKVWNIRYVLKGFQLFHYLKKICFQLIILFLEFSASPCGWSHSDSAQSLLCASDWRILWREWFQSPLTRV